MRNYLRPFFVWLHNHSEVEFHWRVRHWRFDLEIDAACPLMLGVGINFRLLQGALMVPCVLFVVEYK